MSWTALRRSDPNPNTHRPALLKTAALDAEATSSTSFIKSILWDAIQKVGPGVKGATVIHKGFYLPQVAGSTTIPPRNP